MKTNLGQSLFEVVVALEIVALVIIALISLSSSSVSNTSFSKNQTLASRYTQEAIEWIRGRRDMGWDEPGCASPYDGCFNRWVNLTPLATERCLPNLSSTPVLGVCQKDVASHYISGTPFRRSIKFTDDSSSLGPGQVAYLVEVFVRWEEKGATREVRSTTQLTNWQDF